MVKRPREDVVEPASEASSVRNAAGNHLSEISHAIDSNSRQTWSYLRYRLLGSWGISKLSSLSTLLP